MVLMTSVLMLMVLLAGCYQPIKNYKQDIHKIAIPNSLEEMEVLSSECTQRLNDIILDSSSQQFSDFNEKLEFLGYHDLETSINNLKDLLQKTLLSCEELKITDQYIAIHQMLLDILSKYKEEIYYLDEVAKANKDILKMHYDVQSFNDQILEVTLSGKPTSIEYKTALEDFVKANHDLLKLFDNEYAKAVLSGASLDEKSMIVSIKEARDLIEDLRLIQTFNHTDGIIHNLLIQMYERILDMYDYTLNHKEIIEWSNQYKSFSDYAEVQKQSITRDMKEWEKAIDILE